MRVIAGQFGRRRLQAPRGLDVRPTSDMLRETLFNVLTAGNPEALGGSVWVDAFAGSGAVGIEALSRGAAMVYFLEPARAAAAAIRQNLRALGVEAGFEIHEREAAPALQRLESAGITCDVCFLDPPWADHDAYAETLGVLAAARLLKPAGVVVAEHDKRFDPGAALGKLARYRRLDQGDASLSFYRVN
jgi:16S rRNA (guanine(966)-N(2))-methyltransferase RsmD